MAEITSLSKQELQELHKQLLLDYDKIKAQKLALNMARGKPSSIQLSVSNDMLKLPADGQFKIDEIETRNYGNLDGLPSCKHLFAEVLGVKDSEVFIGGSASLNLMYDVIAKAYTHGLLHSKKPWAKLDKVKFLCPAPGYDRHFAISQSFGMELITVPMTDVGPDMDVVEELVKDPDVRGMWCVPKYSNPAGIIYSDETIARIAALKPAAEDFLLMWDNAYCVHEFDGDFVPFKEILSACREAGNPDMPFEFASTSKITFPGAGVACFACSEDNMAYMKKLWGIETIGYDKINQLRHVLFLKDKQGVLDHMKRHAAIMKPKFDVVLEYLDREIKPLGFAHWNVPKGGYFISLDTMEGCAKRTHALCKEAGVVLTGAGATYPYGKDPQDANLRIAPSFPPLDELRSAMEVLCTCLKLAATEKLLED